MMARDHANDTRRLVVNLTKLEEDEVPDARGRAWRKATGFAFGVGMGSSVVALSLWAFLDPSAAGAFLRLPRQPETSLPTATSESSTAPRRVGLDGSGYVVARQLVRLSAQVTGRITRISVEPGATVRRGDVVAELNNDIAAAEVAQASAQVASVRRDSAAAELRLEQATRDLMATKDLANRGIVSLQELDSQTTEVAALRARSEAIRNDVRAARTRLELQREQLEHTRILAPFDGVVLDVDAHVGQVVSPIGLGGNGQSGILTIVDPESLEGQVDVSEQHLSRVAVGQRVEVRAPSHPGSPTVGRVSHVTGAVDRNTGSVKVRIDFENRAHLIPGMRIDVTFLPLDAGPPQRS